MVNLGCKPCSEKLFSYGQCDTERRLGVKDVEVVCTSFDLDHKLVRGCSPTQTPKQS